MLQWGTQGSGGAVIIAWIVQFFRGARPGPILAYVRTSVLRGSRFRLITVLSLPMT